MIVLYKDKKDCTGCSACFNKCPVKAITMVEDEEGFIFPSINRELCIECGMCKEVCPIHNRSITGNDPKITFAAINKDKKILSNSSSGGVFGALAKIVLNRNGVVFGCAYNKELKAEHIYIEDSRELFRLQGSKYVQSDIDKNYCKVKEFLDAKKWVLFSGTPCQIKGLKLYLGREYEKLLTIDLICHGVPNANFFNGYINSLEKKINSKIKSINFRDKKEGWNLTGELIYENKNKFFRKKLMTIDCYYNYFLNGDIYRKSCYVCRYACKKREGDFTIGDYWGIEKSHSKINIKQGVSALMINTQKGKELLSELNKYLNLIESNFENVAEQNEQLNKPNKISLRRKKIFELWKKGGYELVENSYKTFNREKIILFHIKRLIPEKIKIVLKRFINL